MAGTSRHLVVDGSNIATESRTVPSLEQLDEAVRAVQAEDPSRQVTVIVDATFAHRIDASERKMFEEASDAGEIIMPPAGAVGRGDAFILQVAERADAAVLSNDSFQEFHGEHPWLFEEGRLIGGKPVEGIGWVFVPRVPVRGPASRRATRSGRTTKKASSGSKKGRRSASAEAQGPPPKPTAATPPPGKRERRSTGDADRRKQERRSGGSGRGRAAKAKAKDGEKKTKGRGAAAKDAGDQVEEPVRSKKEQKEEIEPAKPGRGGAKRSGGRKRSPQKSGQMEELNSARDFMLFVTQHSIGDEVSGIVERFSSHGCYLRAASAQCYLPSSAMGDPPPSRARDVVSIGQTIIVKVESLDSDRRGINVALVRVVSDDGAKQGNTSSGDSRGTKASKSSQQRAPVADEAAREANLTRSETIVATKKKAAKTARKKPAAKKATKKKAAKATSSARATKASARKAAQKRPAAKKATKKTTKKATKKKATKRPAAKKTTRKTTKKTATKKKATKRPAAKKTTRKTTKKTATKRPAAKKTTKKTTKKATRR